MSATFRAIEFPCQIAKGDILFVEASDSYEDALYFQMQRDDGGEDRELDVVLDRQQALELAKRITEYYGATAPVPWVDR